MMKVNICRKCRICVSGFPNVVGCVDGTQIKIKAPNVNEGEYVNRKGFHSLNVQVIFFPTKWTIKIKVIYAQCIIKLKYIG